MYLCRVAVCPLELQNRSLEFEDGKLKMVAALDLQVSIVSAITATR
jgi:hypothetical protein